MPRPGSSVADGNVRQIDIRTARSLLTVGLLYSVSNVGRHAYHSVNYWQFLNNSCEFFYLYEARSTNGVRGDYASVLLPS